MARINGGVGEYFTQPVSGVGGDPSGIGQAGAFRDGSLGHQQGEFRDGSLGNQQGSFRDGVLGQNGAFRDGSLGATIRPSGLLRSATSGLAGRSLGELSQSEVAGLVALGLLVRGAAGYFAGCAMDRKYRWWGAGSAAVGGALGLGILGFIVYSNRH